MTGMNTAGGTTDIREFGYELWNYLTGKEALIEYSFTDMSVEVDTDQRDHRSGMHSGDGSAAN